MNDRILGKQKPLTLNVQSIGNLWEKFVETSQPDFSKYEGAEIDIKTAFVAGALSIVAETLKVGILHIKPEHKQYIFDFWKTESLEFLKEVHKNNELAKAMRGKIQ